MPLPDDVVPNLKDSSILPTVAEHIADSLGMTRKFVEFVLKYLPDPPQLRPPEWAQFDWESSRLKTALRTIYGYRSDALHDGRPFPGPMCGAPVRLDSSRQAPAEKTLAQPLVNVAGVATRRYPHEAASIRVHGSWCSLEVVGGLVTHQSFRLRER